MRLSTLPKLYTAVFFNILGYGMVSPLLPLYVTRLGGDAALAGVLGALYAAMQLISGPILGALSDRHGRKPVLLVCFLGTAMSYALLAAAASLPALFAAIALDGLTGGNLTIAYASVADSAPANARAAALARAGAAFGFGVLAGPALGGALAAISLQTPAWAAAGLALANTLFAAFLIDETLPAGARRLQSTRETGAAATDVAAVWPGRLLSGYRGSGLAALFATLFFANAAFAGLQANFPLFSQARFGWTAQSNGYFFAFVGMCAVLAQGVLVHPAQRLAGERRMVVAGCAALALGLAGIALATQGWMLYPITALAALGSGLGLPALAALASARSVPAAQGALMGRTQVVIGLANVSAPLLAGALFVRVGAAAPYWLGALCALAALAVFTRGGLRPAAIASRAPDHPRR